MDSPYKIVAADVNNDKELSAADLLEVRKLILGTIVEFKDNGSWRFIDAGFEFEDPTDVFATPIPGDYKIPTLNNDMTIDFIALKIGDVNNNAVSSLNNVVTTTRDRQSIELVAENQEFTDGEFVSVPVSFGTDMTVTGMQFTLEMNNSLEFNGLTSKALDINDNNIGFSKLSDGMISISWDTPEGMSLDADEVLFEINFTSVVSGEIANELKINSKAIDAEMYDSNLETYSIDFVIGGRDVNTNEFVLYQNTPNPFGESTLITFDLPETLSGSLTVFDVTG